MKLSDITPNERNPRFIKDAKFDKLKKSISELEKMMSLRPIIVDENNIILGGNMRYRALKALGYKDIPNEWVKKAEDLTEEEKKRFIIEDNVGFGEWDFDMLANEWEVQELTKWGVDLPFINDAKEVAEEKEEELKPFASCHILISYCPDMHNKVMDVVNGLEGIEGVTIEKSANLKSE